MSNEDNDTGKLELKLPPFTIEASAILVAASKGSQEEQEIYYPATTATGIIVANSTAEIGLHLSPEEQGQMIEAVDYAKTHKPYISEFEISLNIKEGFKFRIKRQPKKIIKYYSKE